MIGITRALLLSSVLAAIAGGVYMVSSPSRQFTRDTPTFIADSFIRAVILGDINKMGLLLGMDQSRGSSTDQIVGQALSKTLERYWSEQAQNPADYRWKIHEQRKGDSEALLTIELFRPNYGAWASRTDELLGFKVQSDGSYAAPDEPAMSFEEASRQAHADPAIQPLHYRVPLRVVMHEGRWVIDPQSDINDALVSVIRRGDSLTDNEAYRVK